jgi:hypothetical protein
MGKVNLPNIPDVPDTNDLALKEHLRAIKETLEILTGKLGGNRKLIDLMEEE